jgi:hypothetical protein
MMLGNRLAEERSPSSAGPLEAVAWTDSGIVLATVGPHRAKTGTCLGQSWA